MTSLATRLDTMLSDLPKAYRTGVVAYYTSGDRITAGAYSRKAKGARVIRTYLTIAWRAGCWQLIKVQRLETWPECRVGFEPLKLTSEQYDRIAAARMTDFARTEN